MDRRSRKWASVTLTVCALFLLGAPVVDGYISGYYSTRYDAPDDNYLWGTLTWNKDVGGLSWGSAPATENQGIGKSEQIITPPASCSTSSDTCPGPTTEFQSEPVPADLFTNASRYIVVDLLVDPDTTGSAETSTPPVILDDVELWANSTFVGGAPHDEGLSYDAACPPKQYGERPSCKPVGSSRVDLQACKLEYSIVSPK